MKQILKKSIVNGLALMTAILLLSGSAFAEDEHEIHKTKITAIDRVETEADAQFKKSMHTSYMNDSKSPYGTGGNLYQTLTLTGEILGEEQIYSVNDIEQLASMSMNNQKMNAIGLIASGTYSVPEGVSKAAVNRSFAGLDLLKFLNLCGVPSESSCYLQIYSAGQPNQPAAVFTLKQLEDYNRASGQAPCLLAFGLSNNKPLVKDSTSPGYASCCGNGGGPLRIVLPGVNQTAICIDSVDKILIGKTKDAVDPHYELHNREPFTNDLDKTFTVNVYENTKGKDSAPIKTKVFTTGDLEKLALEYPDHVVRNNYGLIGNRDIFDSMGLGGFLDYFEGLELRWLLETQVGLPSFSGSAELYGRDGQVYTTIKDLSYLNNRSGDYSKYTITTQEKVDIPDAVPMIAFSKNGYPLLPEHVHSGAGYYDYNFLNKALEKAGVETEVGVIKNHNGPFAACLGNLDQSYGGYQIETGGDCVQINLYLDVPKEYADAADHWARDAISFVQKEGLFTGVSEDKFNPNGTMTRGMLVTALGRLAGANDSIQTDQSKFVDVNASAYYAPYVNWALELGIVKGVSADKFAPNQPVSRQELAEILYLYKISRGMTCSCDTSNCDADMTNCTMGCEPAKKSGASVSDFTDQGQVAAWAEKGVSCMHSCGIMSGDKDNNFCPRQYATRAETASVLMRYVSMERQEIIK